MSAAVWMGGLTVAAVIALIGIVSALRSTSRAGRRPPRRGSRRASPSAGTSRTAPKGATPKVQLPAPPSASAEIRLPVPPNSLGDRMAKRQQGADRRPGSPPR